MYVLTIAGVEKEFIQHTLVIEESTSVRSVARFVMTNPGTYRPSRRDEVIITENGIRKFGGLVNIVTERGMGGEPISQIELLVDCIDFNTYADWVHVVNGGFPAGVTYEFALTSLAAGLSPYGVTLDAGQVTGPILPTLLYDARSYTSILNELTDVTGFIWEIDYHKVLRGFVPGTTAAPFNIVEGVSSTIGDIEVEPVAGEYANRIIGRFGTGTREVVDSFTGNGTTSSFAINYFPRVASRGYVNVNGTVVGTEVTGGVNETLSIGASGSATWNYDPNTGILTRAAPLGNGDVANFIYTAQFPVAVTRNNTGEQPPVIGVVQDLPEVFVRETAIAIFDARLARLAFEPRMARYKTRQSGLATGQSQTITVAKRGLSAIAFYITEITETHEEGDLVRYDVTALEGTSIQNSWHDIYREWSELGGGGGASSVAGPTPGTGAAGAAGPVNSVQYHAPGGIFGGDEDFKYYPDTNSMALGQGSTVAEIGVESCFAIGVNCHVTP